MQPWTSPWLSPLCPAILPEASYHFGAAANGAELRKLNANSTKCTDLGWTFIPMAVETHLVIGVGRLRVYCLGWHPTCQYASPSPELQWLPTFMDVSTSSW